MIKSKIFASLEDAKTFGLKKGVNIFRHIPNKGWEVTYIKNKKHKKEVATC